MSGLSFNLGVKPVFMDTQLASLCCLNMLRFLLTLLALQGQSPSIRQLIMHSMAEWYMRGEQYDQAKLSRILDVAQDLKVCQPAPTTVRTHCVSHRLSLKNSSAPEEICLFAVETSYPSSGSPQSCDVGELDQRLREEAAALTVLKNPGRTEERLFVTSS